MTFQMWCRMARWPHQPSHQGHRCIHVHVLQVVTKGIFTYKGRDVAPPSPPSDPSAQRVHEECLPQKMFRSRVTILPFLKKSFLNMYLVQTMAHKATIQGTPLQLIWSTDTGLQCLGAVVPGTMEQHYMGKASECQHIQVMLRYSTLLTAKFICFLQLHPHAVLYYRKLRLAVLILAQQEMPIEVARAIVTCPFASLLQCFDELYQHGLFFSLYLAQRAVKAHRVHVWFVFSSNFIISKVFSGLIYHSLYPSIVLDQMWSYILWVSYYIAMIA